MNSYRRIRNRFSGSSVVDDEHRPTDSRPALTAEITGDRAIVPRHLVGRGVGPARAYKNSRLRPCRAVCNLVARSPTRVSYTRAIDRCVCSDGVASQRVADRGGFRRTKKLVRRSETRPLGPMRAGEGRRDRDDHSPTDRDGARVGEREAEWKGVIGSDVEGNKRWRERSAIVGGGENDRVGGDRFKRRSAVRADGSEVRRV